MIAAEQDPAVGTRPCCWARCGFKVYKIRRAHSGVAAKLIDLIAGCLIRKGRVSFGKQRGRRVNDISMSEIDGSASPEPWRLRPIRSRRYLILHPLKQRAAPRAPPCVAKFCQPKCGLRTRASLCCSKACRSTTPSMRERPPQARHNPINVSWIVWISSLAISSQISTTRAAPGPLFGHPCFCPDPEVCVGHGQSLLR